MKLIRQLLIITLLLLFSFPMNAKTKEKLTIKIENVKVSTGLFYVAVYNSKQGFDEERIYKKYTLSNKVRSLTIALEKGEYSIKIFQDVNNDKKLNSIFGIPREPYGLSNNPKGFPTWDNTVFSFEKTGVLKIKMSF